MAMRQLPASGIAQSRPRRAGVGGVRPVYEDFKPISEWKQEEQSHVLLIYLPGFTKEQLKVSTEDADTLRVRGERFVGGNKWSRFQEEFRIPEDCSYIRGTRAKYEGGILTIRLPKKSPAQAAPRELEPISTTTNEAAAPTPTPAPRPQPQAGPRELEPKSTTYETPFPPAPKPQPQAGPGPGELKPRSASATREAPPPPSAPQPRPQPQAGPREKPESTTHEAPPPAPQPQSTTTGTKSVVQAGPRKLEPKSAIPTAPTPAASPRPQDATDIKPTRYDKGRDDATPKNNIVESTTIKVERKQSDGKSSLKASSSGHKVATEPTPTKRDEKGKEPLTKPDNEVNKIAWKEEAKETELVLVINMGVAVLVIGALAAHLAYTIWLRVNIV